MAVERILALMKGILGREVDLSSDGAQEDGYSSGQWIVLGVITAALLWWGVACVPLGRASPPTTPVSAVVSTLIAMPVATSTPLPSPTFTPSPSPTPSLTPSPTPAFLQLAVRWEPQQVRQGETAILWVETTRPASVEVNFDGVSLTLVSLDANRAWGLMPVPMWNVVGSRPLVVTAWAQDGRERVRQVFHVPVEASAFPEEALMLPPDRAALLDPQVVRAEWERIRPIFETVTPQRLWEGKFTWPLTGTVTTEFGTRRRYQGSQTYEYHGALDIAAPEGTPVYVPAAGRVVFSDLVQVRGNLIILDHGMGLHTAYFHMARRNVAVGAEVQPGDKIGEVGSTGLSTGPHLHWEVRVYTVAVNPRQWIAHPWLLPDKEYSEQ